MNALLTGKKNRQRLRCRADATAGRLMLEGGCRWILLGAGERGNPHLVRQWLRLALQREVEYLVDPLDWMDVQPVFDVFRDIHQILGVLLRNQDNLDAGAMRRQQLLL